MAGKSLYETILDESDDEYEEASPPVIEVKQIRARSHSSGASRAFSLGMEALEGLLSDKHEVYHLNTKRWPDILENTPEPPSPAAVRPRAGAGSKVRQKTRPATASRPATSRPATSRPATARSAKSSASPSPKPPQKLFMSLMRDPAKQRLDQAYEDTRREILLSTRSEMDFVALPTGASPRDMPSEGVPPRTPSPNSAASAAPWSFSRKGSKVGSQDDEQPNKHASIDSDVSPRAYRYLNGVAELW